MALNRMYLRCKKCGDTLFLGKTFGNGYYFANYETIELEDSLNVFYSEHETCGENCFEIEYEEERE